MPSDGDTILFALSAWRTASRSLFKRCFDEVHRVRVEQGGLDRSTETALHRWRTLRVLTALGHVDIATVGGLLETIAVAPPALVSIPGTGIRRAILCGARSPGTATSLRAAAVKVGASAISESQARYSPYAPARIEIQAESDQAIENVAGQLNIPYFPRPPARAIAQLAGSLDEYLSGLSWSSDDNLDWQREDFDIDRLWFGRARNSNDGPRLSRYQDPVRTTWRYRLYRDGQYSEVDADWGRLAILAWDGKEVLSYQRAERTVRAPVTVPLPVLASRAFALCSGFAPKVTTRRDVRQPRANVSYDSYERVPPSVFASVARKLGQEAS